MKWKLWVAVSAIVAMTSVGCGSDQAQDPHQAHGSNAPQKLTINFATNPSPVKVGEEAELVANISQGDAKVEDAKVEFEIWRGEEKHETLKATGKDGVYSLKKSFAEAGKYQVTIHTTTKEIHQMPTVSFEVVK
ncbi:FixH family protein [Tumebacillus lipolyticus]|uniref:FixH family protein n=1 Tax=Tumebacillus lipolyticus TaxID=1280370 RepID=A0ABW4ZWV2_9BACL